MEDQTMFDFDAHWSEVFAALNSESMLRTLENTVRSIADERHFEYIPDAPVCIYLYTHGTEKRLRKEVLQQVGFSLWESEHSHYEEGTYDIDEVIAYFRQNRDRKFWWVFPGSKWAKIQTRLASLVVPSVHWHPFRMFTNKFIVTDMYHRFVFDLWAWVKVRITITHGDVPSEAFRKFCQEQESFNYAIDDEEIYREAIFFSPIIIYQDRLTNGVNEYIDNALNGASGKASSLFYAEMAQ